MDLVHNTGKNRKNTGGILSIFAEIMRQIGGAVGGKALIIVSLKFQIELTAHMRIFPAAIRVALCAGHGPQKWRTG
jgi:hypothetical protein